MFGIFILSLPLLVQSLHKVVDPQPKHEAAEEEEVGMNTKLWSELDANLMGEIVGRLCLTDKVRFGCVCKNWRAVASHPFNNNTKSLPWYLTFDRSLATLTNTLQIQLYDLSSSSSSSSNQPLVHNISFTKLGIPTTPRCYVNIASTFNRNWLFMIIGRQRFLSSPFTRYFLLFSPFTRKTITLPKFDSTGFSFLLTFSTHPDSPDCVFFLLDARNAGKICIRTYRRGHKRWTATQFKTLATFVPCICYPVYLNGLLYIVSPLGQLASYNIVDAQFKFERLSIDILFLQSFLSFRRHTVFELNGDLMILYFGSYDHHKNATLSGKQFIKRYNWSNKRWIPVSTLGDQALFVSDTNLGVAIINKEDMSDGVLSNKIYHFFDGGCLIYSIQGGELVEYKSINSRLLGDGDRDGDLPEYKYDCGIQFSNTNHSGYWLKPPCVRVHSS